MLALYRSDRQADALRAYGRLRRRLAEELGLDPSAKLQRLEQQIICGDPALRPDHTGGAFLQGMVDDVDHRPDSLDRVLTEIDQAWP